MEVEQILIRPLLTEKTNELQSGTLKKYSFEVNPRANKEQVLYAVRKLFRVSPVSCNILNVKGKKKRNLPIFKSTFVRGHGFTKSWKKAIVTLPEGEVINALDSGEMGA